MHMKGGRQAPVSHGRSPASQPRKPPHRLAPLPRVQINQMPQETAYFIVRNSALPTYANHAGGSAHRNGIKPFKSTRLHVCVPLG